MPGSAPWDVVGAVRDGTAAGVFEVEDPQTVAAQLLGGPGLAVVAAEELPSALAGVRVGLARVLAARARQAESAVGEPTKPPAAGAPSDAEAQADWQAVRFSLLILLFALPAGLAVWAVDGTVVAAVLPAAALVALGVVVLVHQPRDAPAPTDEPAPANDRAQVPVDDAPAVRTAEAHLRRQQATWKVTWWERGEPVPDLDRWSALTDRPETATLVVVDSGRTVDEAAHAAMTAALPGTIRLVVLAARASKP